MNTLRVANCFYLECFKFIRDSIAIVKVRYKQKCLLVSKYRLCCAILVGFFFGEYNEGCLIYIYIEINFITDMSDIVSVTPFRFEEFPDEILLEIFKCVEPVDLHSFFGHNRRFNNIIQDIKLNIVIQYPEYENEDFNYLSCLLPKQFIRLELQYSWDELDLNTFKELRSLTVNCNSLSEQQFDQVSVTTWV